MSRDETEGLSYDEVYGERAYDEEGNDVQCDWCGGDIIWKDGQYYCFRCDEVWPRQKFFDYIGAQPPGKECVTCDNLYPGCMVCKYGYIKDEEF